MTLVRKMMGAMSPNSPDEDPTPDNSQASDSPKTGKADEQPQSDEQAKASGTQSPSPKSKGKGKGKSGGKSKGKGKGRSKRDGLVEVRFLVNRAGLDFVCSVGETAWLDTVSAENFVRRNFAEYMIDVNDDPSE